MCVDDHTCKGASSGHVLKTAWHDNYNRERDVPQRLNGLLSSRIKNVIVVNVSEMSGMEKEEFTYDLLCNIDVDFIRFIP